MTPSEEHHSHNSDAANSSGMHFMETKLAYLIPVVALLGAMVVTGIILKMKTTPASTPTPVTQQMPQTSNNPVNTAPPQGTLPAASDDVSTVVAEVAKLIVLPSGETPKVVTITNVDQLRKDQPFFSDANNGDKLLVYSKKVILFNPRTNRVVDIAQIKFNPQGQ